MPKQTLWHGIHPKKPNRDMIVNTIQATNRHAQAMPLACNSPTKGPTVTRQLAQSKLLTDTFRIKALAWNSPPKANRYAVVGIMPLVRTWVITDYLFPLADLLYLARDGIDSSHASCMIIFELVFFFLHIIFSSFHPFTFRFPALPNAQPLRGNKRNGSHP